MLFQQVYKADLDRQIHSFLSSIYRLESVDKKKFDLSWMEMHLLKILSLTPLVGMTCLAQELNIPLFKASRLISRLKGKGYLIRSESKNDKRKRIISLTVAGEQFLNEIEAFHYQLITCNLKKVDKKVVDSFIVAIDNFDQILETGCSEFN